MSSGTNPPERSRQDTLQYPDSGVFSGRLRDSADRAWANFSHVRVEPPAPGQSRAAQLYALTTALSVAATPADVADAVVKEATSAFAATGSVIARIVADGSQLEIMKAGAMPADILDAWRCFSIDLPVPLADVARTGTPIFLESRADWLSRYPDSMALLETTDHQSHIVAPLIVEARSIGALGITFDRPRTFSEPERSLALAMAHQCALALDRARLFDMERAARAEAEAARAAAEEARERADEANRAKTKFLTTMSHELRTPLNAIAGYAQLLAMGIHGPVTSAQAEALTRITRNQRHLLGLINDVLNFARIEAGSVPLDLQRVSVAAMFADVDTLVAPQIGAKGQRHGYRCDPSLMAFADAEKLRQILLNLISNAVKFTPDGGEISLDAETDGAKVVIRVRDSGIGISAEQQERVFEPFVQLGRDLSSVHGGTGLGLAISRDLARLMGGELHFESVVGSGTAFVLTLPGRSPAEA